MPDIGKAVEQLGQTLQSAFEKKPLNRPLRRHRDDDYWDQIDIEVSDGTAVLRAYMAPRYKTSGLSGDEWRVSAKLKVTADGADLVDRGFHRMRDLTKYAPHFIWRQANAILERPHATLLVRRKGLVLFHQSFASFGDAAMGLGWHIVIANEGSADVKWYHLSDAEELEYCQQVGCAEPPKNFYHIKKLQLTPSESLMVEPKYDFEGQYTWYCERHSRRGDCGFEDADTNLELVEGDGLSGEHASDESPSALAGVVEIGDPE